MGIEEERFSMCNAQASFPAFGKWNVLRTTFNLIPW
jgi:hypothetical protein